MGKKIENEWKEDYKWMKVQPLPMIKDYVSIDKKKGRWLTRTSAFQFLLDFRLKSFPVNRFIPFPILMPTILTHLDPDMVLVILCLVFLFEDMTFYSFDIIW